VPGGSRARSPGSACGQQCQLVNSSIGRPGYGVAAGTGLSGPAKAELSLQMFWLPLMPW